LRDKSNEYGTFSHFSMWPQATPGPLLLNLLLHSDDNIFPGKNSCELRHSARQALLRKN
jgi:hypothetical protein